VAIQVVIISFRAGVLAAEAGAQVSLDIHNTGASWATIYPGLSVESANTVINSFSESHVCYRYSSEK
jgi:hypothetical protein